MLLSVSYRRLVHVVYPSVPGYRHFYYLRLCQKPKTWSVDDKYIFVFISGHTICFDLRDSILRSCQSSNTVSFKKQH